MPNTSATGGPLAPLPSPAPLDGQELLDKIQEWVVGVTGMEGTLVRPSWQPEPPNVPTAGEAWCALAIKRRPFDNYPAVVHGDNVDHFQRHERLDVLASFYDLGSGGEADALAGLLRDGCMVAQNLEALLPIRLETVGDYIAVPALLKTRWQYRADLDITLIRQIDRDYRVLDLLGADITIQSDDGVVTSADISP